MRLELYIFRNIYLLKKIARMLLHKFFLKARAQNFTDGAVVRIHVPMQGTWVQSVVGEDLTCATITELACHNYWSLCTSSRQAPQKEKSAKREARAPQWRVSSSCSPWPEKTWAQQGRYQCSQQRNKQSPGPNKGLKRPSPYLGLRIMSTPWFPQLCKRITQLDVLHIAIIRFPCVHGLENFLKPQNQP